MKIFGKKRKSKVVDATDESSTPSDAAAANAGDEKNTPTKVEESIPSYFASSESTTSGKKKKKKPRNDNNDNQQIKGDDIEALLAMDPSELNAKQRRLVRRHKERDDTNNGATDKDAKQMSNTRDAEKEDTTNTNEATKITTDAPTTNEEKVSADNPDIKDILAKLDGLNSKERRKYLRQLKSSSGGAIDESVIAAAQEQAKKVAERNEKEAANAPTPVKKKSAEKAPDTEQSKPKKKRRKKGPPVDESTLPPEERKRREEQRRMQKEAASRREAGLVDPNRHPLNSERRRANRRKPSQAMLIAQAKKEKMAEKGRFNAVGFQMRANKKG